MEFFIMHKTKALGKKIRKIHKEGIRGKKVSHKQAVGAAFGILKSKHKK